MEIPEIKEQVIRADFRIRKYIRETYLDYSPVFSDMTGSRVYMKLENLQHTGSFKVRGALNKILSLSGEEIKCGVVTASTGNHGAAVAFALSQAGTEGIIFVPENASETKLESIRRIGGEIHYHGTDNADTEIYAREYARKNYMTYISPYNDPMVVAGQGTIGMELLKQLNEMDSVFVSLGGGGLISGIAGYLKSIRPEIQVIGCSPENSQVMIRSVRSGKILNLPSLPTLSDGTAGGLEPEAITFEFCRNMVDDYITVTEDEIAENMRLFMSAHHMLIEGAAGVALASFLKHKDRMEGKNVVIIICGGNISPDTLKSVL
jgi:threonine dehydratase